jgi:monoamine oxidase
MPTLYTTLLAQHGSTVTREPVRTAKSGKVRKAKRPKKALLALALQHSTLHAVSSRAGRIRGKVCLGTNGIAVIGGGLAGLCAAYELQSLGYNVNVYEARGRVSGRVHSLNNFVSGKTVEGGGELIGSNHPLWNSYARHFGLEFSDALDYGNSPIRLDGKTLSFEESKKLNHAVRGLSKELDKLAELIVDPFEPWTNRDAARLDRESLQSWIDKAKGEAEYKKAFREQLETDNGVEARHQSLLGVLAMIKGGGIDRYWSDTEVYRCRGGNQQLAENFRARLNDKKGGTVVLNAEVKVVWREGKEIFLQVRRPGKRKGKKPGSKKVETMGPFDDLILAVPPSVWHLITFKDFKLARQLKKAPRMGANIKYLMEFQHRFWEDFSSSPNLTEDGPVDLTWETTEAEKDPGYAMVVFSGAKDARELSNLGDKRVKKRCLDSMKAPYPGIGKEIRKGKFMNWPKKPWTMASYYFPRPGEVTRWGPFWHAGYDGWLHFAGEHTCYAFVGYMEGALASGFRLARRIAVRDGIFPA